MAVFLLRTLGGRRPTRRRPAPRRRSTTCPAATRFAPWIDELVRRGITGGCGGGHYCPATGRDPRRRWPSSWWRRSAWSRSSRPASAGESGARVLVLRARRRTALSAAVRTPAARAEAPDAEARHLGPHQQGDGHRLSLEAPLPACSASRGAPCSCRAWRRRTPRRPRSGSSEHRPLALAGPWLNSVRTQVPRLAGPCCAVTDRRRAGASATSSSGPERGPQHEHAAGASIVFTTTVPLAKNG